MHAGIFFFNIVCYQFHNIHFHAFLYKPQCFFCHETRHCRARRVPMTFDLMPSHTIRRIGVFLWLPAFRRTAPPLFLVLRALRGAAAVLRRAAAAGCGFNVLLSSFTGRLKPNVYRAEKGRKASKALENISLHRSGERSFFWSCCWVFFFFF